MTRLKFKLAKLAKQDLDDIWLFVARHNIESADKVLDEIQARFLLLARYQEMGIARDELLPGLRSFPVEQFLIFYRLTEQGIEIVRVLSGKVDIQRSFRDDSSPSE